MISLLLSMKNKPFVLEIALSVFLVGLTLLFLNPLQAIWMPTMFMSMVLVGFIVAFVVFSAFIWRESDGDERDMHHRLMAGRFGFLSGCAVLVGAIIYQSLQHQLDPWLLMVLIVMVLSKLISRIALEKHC